MAAKSKRRRLTRSQRAGLTFPVARLRRLMKEKLGKRRRIAWGAAAYFAAVLEYLTAEMLEIAGNATKDLALKRIIPRHILLAVGVDDELKGFLKNVTLPSAGVLPNINSALIPDRLRMGSSSKVGHQKQQQQKVTKSAPAKKTKAVGGSPKATKAAAGRQQQRQQKGMTTLNERTLMNGQRLTVISGDIINVLCDAIVVPSGSDMNLGGEVGSRLSQVGGAKFQALVNSAAAVSPLPTANAKHVKSANCGFTANGVILCNGPSWKAADDNAIPLLEKTVTNCLREAERQRVESLCFPSIGSGRGGFPKQTAAQTILKTISDYCKSTRTTSIKQIYFILFDQQSISVYVSELGRFHE